MPPSPTNIAEPVSGQRQLAVLALSQGGCVLGQSLAQDLGGDFFACKGKMKQTFFQVWQDYRAIICIMATGIVIRTMAPLLQSKQQDPAVVVCDEQGRFAISLLSGHLGGANQLAQRTAAALGGQAVLTTASDVLGYTALDLWCRDLGLLPADKTRFTQAMGRLVDTGQLRLWSRFPLPPLPRDLKQVKNPHQADLLIDDHEHTASHAAVLYPASLVFGIGCNRGTPEQQIAQAVAATCQAHHLSPAAIKGLASIDLKQDELGLLAYAANGGKPLVFFNKEQLNQVEGVSVSAVVQRATGAKGVAEPAALLAAGPGSSLLVPKMKWPDVTTAVARIASPLTASATSFNLNA